MTNREFYNAIINSEVSADLKAHAENEIAKLDARNAKRASTPSKTQVANAPLIEAVREYLEKATEPKCSAEIAEALEMTSNKVAALLKNIEVEVSEKHYNKRKVKAYALVKGE
jgi:methylphosphotriester-DNA--protein-cysteine methyltransferase